MINVIIMGAHGTGKGTQSKRLAANPHFKSENGTGFVHISTGELLRAEMADNTELGQHITETMNKGEYVSDAIASSMVMNKTHLHGGYKADGFIFDGFPRTEEQVTFLDRVITSFKAEINIVLNIVVDGKILLERIMERGAKENRPEDQDKKLVIKRMKTYAAESAPVLNTYRERGLVVDIDGVGTEEEVYERILNAITGE